MHPVSAEGGAGPISFQVIARSWSRRVALLTSDVNVFQALRYLECDPEIAGASQDDVVVSVEPHGSCFRIVQEKVVLSEQRSAKDVTEFLHGHLVLLSLDDFPTTPLIHGASLRREGHRILLVGPKGAGKTTLTLRLIQEGYEFEGDENVFVTFEGVLARARGIRIKKSTATILPKLTELLSAAPYYENNLGDRIYNVDPRQAGASIWRIEMGPVEAVAILRPNHGGKSSMRPVSSLALVQEVLRETGLPETERAAAIGAIAKVIGNARGFELSLGDLAGAVDCINQVLEDLAD